MSDPVRTFLLGQERARIQSLREEAARALANVDESAYDPDVRAGVLTELADRLERQLRAMESDE